MKKRKILIVDDEVAFLVMLEQSFELEGYEVDTAENAEEALRLIKEQEYPVMFFDIKMPGMNGIDLFKEVKKIYTDPLVYVMTGYPSQFEQEGCLAMGFRDYFVKPLLFERSWKRLRRGFGRVLPPRHHTSFVTFESA